MTVRTAVSVLRTLLLVPVAAVLMTACADKRGGPIPYDVQSFGVPD